jgi:hypothetical protein
MAGHPTVNDKRDRAMRTLQRAAAGSDAELNALEMLAEVNEKTMSVAGARAWAAEFVLSHPDATEWAWEFVGSVKVHQRSRRGPKPTADMGQVDLVYDPIVKAAAKTLGFQSQKLSKEEVDDLLDMVNGVAQSRLHAPLNRSQLKLVVRRVLPGR